MKFVRDECDNPMVWNEGLTMVGYIAPLHRGMLAGQVPVYTFVAFVWMPVDSLFQMDMPSFSLV